MVIDSHYGFSIELADLIIRVLDMAELFEINMEKAIKLKMEYNKLVITDVNVKVNEADDNRTS